LDGIIAVDKPAGMTSFDVIAILRRAAGERRAGHSGTLDPMATGVLPVFFGKATKAIQWLPRTDKRYEAGMKLGVTTDTGDITGRVTGTAGVNVSPDEVKAAALSLRGEIMQVPPMYSAIKRGGVPLYVMARRGESVEREPRKINIYDISLGGPCSGPGGCEYSLTVHCSSGCYIRTVITDIGRALGCGAVMTSLRRTMASGFGIDNSVPLGELRVLRAQEIAQRYLLPADAPFAVCPGAEITGPQAVRFLNGGELAADRVPGAPQSGLCRLECAGRAVGLGVVRGGSIFKAFAF
jgi:tRNA pseudouridine55 synthase